MPNEPLVSLIIPAYNSQIDVGAAIAGALAQTYANKEVIVVNDGSRDGTRRILEGFGDLIKVVDKPNGGVSSARNAGVAVAEGDYISFADADDVTLPGFLDAMMATLRAAGPGKWWVYSQAYFMSAEGIDLRRPVVFGGPFSPQEQRLAILQRNIAGPPASLVLAEMHREIGGFDESMRSPEDWDYWARAIFNGWSGVLQPKPFYLYRWTESSLSSNREAMLAGEDRIMEKLRELFWDSMSADEQQALERRLRLGSPFRLLANANIALRKQDYPAATELFKQAASVASMDRKLQIKARSMELLPPVARYWRARRLAADKQRRRFDYSAEDADVT